jgi:hypothetical protein
VSQAVLSAPAPSGSPGLAPLIRSLAINLLGPYLLYRAVEGYFPAKSIAPLLISSLIPAAELAFIFARQRRVEVIAVISLVQLAFSLVIALATHSIDAAMVGNAFQPAVQGLLFGGSLLIGRPLMQSVARMTMAGDDPARQARFDAIAASPEGRATFARITLIWTVTLCGETAALLAARKLLAAHDYLLFANAATFAVIGALTWGSIRYGRAVGRQARQAEA